MAYEESSWFTVQIHLETEDGELPTTSQIVSLVQTQMEGCLDEDTGLRCTDVLYLGRQP